MGITRQVIWIDKMLGKLALTVNREIINYDANMAANFPQNYPKNGLWESIE